MTGTPTSKRYPLATKLNLLTVALILITSAGICFFLVRLEVKSYKKDLLSHGQMVAQMIAKNAEFGVYTADRKALSQILGGLSADRDTAYASVLDRSGRQIVGKIFRVDGGRIEQLFPGGLSTDDEPVQDLIDPGNGRRYLDILSPIVSEDFEELSETALMGGKKKVKATVIGHVLLGLTLDSLDRRVRQLVISSVVFTTLIVLIGTALTVLMTRKITAPLKRLTKATQDISKGRFDSPIDIRTTDEICELAESFSLMRGHLQAYRAEVEARIAKERQHVAEKEKIVMDLHDGIGGITTNIRMLAELALRTEHRGEIQEKLNTITQLTHEGSLEIRGLMQSIDTQDMTWNVLAAYVRNLGSTLLDPHRIQFSLDMRIEEVEEQPGSALWINVFKIYKEAVTNVIKHAHAGAVSVELEVNAQGFAMTVRDDGVGYDGLERVGRGQGIMRKRARELGGEVTVSSVNPGTQVGLKIPFPVVWREMGTHY